MKRGDIITLAAGIAIVAVLAVVLNVSGILAAGSPESVPASTPPAATQPVPSGTGTSAAATPEGTVAATPAATPADPVPYRILYTGKPLDYPVFRLPEHMESFGATEIPWKSGTVTFAYIEESRGSLTKEFLVPYELWGMNITVLAWTKPQYARFDMVLCSAADGKVLDGMEITGPGAAFRSVQVSNTDMYLIIHTDNVDRFRIDFITPRKNYNAVAGSS